MWGGGQAVGAREGEERRGEEPDQELRFRAKQEKDSGIAKKNENQKLFLWDPSLLEVRGGKTPRSPSSKWKFFLLIPSPSP